MAINLSDKAFDLYNSLLHRRLDLADLLLKDGDYDNLSKLLKEIEEKIDEKDIIHKLMMAKKTTVNITPGQRSKINELVTKELINVIFCICNVINTKGKLEIHEFNGGSGLLTYLLSKKFEDDKDNDVKFFTYETLLMDTQYYRATADTLQNYITRNIINMDITRICILNWPSRNDEVDIEALLNNKLFDAVFIIGEPYDRTGVSGDFFEHFYEQESYGVSILPVKQLCHLDYFKNDNIRNKKSCRSAVTLLLNNNYSFLTDDIREICGKTNFVENVPENITEAECIQDLTEMELIPSWIIKMEPGLECDKAVRILKNIITKQITLDKQLIPSWLPENNIDILEFWYTIVCAKKFPLLIKTKEQITDYYNAFAKLSCPGGLSRCKVNCSIPLWIDSVKIAEKYLFVDYSTEPTDKSWKEDLVKLLEKYKLLKQQRRIGFTRPINTNIMSSMFSSGEAVRIV